MCSVDAPEPTVIEADKPTFVRNRYLDELDGDVASADALRRGRSSLVIPTNTSIGFEGRGGAGSGSNTGSPAGNSQGPIGNAGGTTGSAGSGTGPYNPGVAPADNRTGRGRRADRRGR